MFLRTAVLILSTYFVSECATNGDIIPVLQSSDFFSALLPKIEFIQPNDVITSPQQGTVCNKEVTEKCCSLDKPFQNTFSLTPSVPLGTRTEATVSLPGLPDLLQPLFKPLQTLMTAPVELIFGHPANQDVNPGSISISLSGGTYISEALRSIFNTVPGAGHLNIPHIILLILHSPKPLLAKLVLFLAFIIRLPVLMYCRIENAIRTMLTPFMQMLKTTLLPVYLVIRVIHFLIWLPVRFIGFMIQHTLLGILEFFYRIVMGKKC